MNKFKLIQGGKSQEAKLGPVVDYSLDYPELRKKYENFATFMDSWLQGRSENITKRQDYQNFKAELLEKTDPELKALLKESTEQRWKVYYVYYTALLDVLHSRRLF